MFQEEALQTLMTLDFHFCNRKFTFVHNIRSKWDKRTTTIKNSEICREVVYRVLSPLEKKGLVEKIIFQATRYKPLPFEDGVRLL